MKLARNAAWVTMLAAAALLAGSCGQSKAPKVDAEAEKAAALERARHDAFGAQVKALDTAKGMQDDLNKKAQEQVEKAEKDTK